MLNSDIYLIALYGILAKMYDNYKLPAKYNALWEKVDKEANSKNLKYYYKYHFNDIVKAQEMLAEVYC